MGKKLDLFGDEEKTTGSNEFAALLDGVHGPGRRLKAGDSLQGEILAIGKDEAFVSTGTPVDGTLPLKELLDANKQMNFKVGERIDVKVVRMREGEILLRREQSTQASDFDSLEDAFDMELPVEGKVLEAVKGGYRVQIASKVAFCPFSHMDLRSAADPEVYIGKKFEFQIIELDQRKFVVSRRKLLELRRAEQEGEFLQKFKTGDLLHGRISRIERFGAFVDLDEGGEALIPISELAWSRVAHPSEIVSVGQEVTVSLLAVSEETHRLKISVSLKQAGEDPWMSVEQSFPPGKPINGVIERKETYGLFVQLAPGVTGLLPRAKWRDRTDSSLYENKKRGDSVQVLVDSVQQAERRISLAPFDEQQDESWRGFAKESGPKGLGTFADLIKDFKSRK